MKLNLPENIRIHRKALHLTQEQLAEVLGVTTGAVYKWEAGLSTPELGLIAALADFYGISIDALLGYEMKDNRLEQILERLERCYQNQDPESLTEAEKALKKYPHSFQVVHTCAKFYLLYGTLNRNSSQLRRAMELLEQSMLLLPQNTDLEISELTLYGEMASVYHALGEHEKSLALFQKHNVEGMFNDSIGAELAVMLHRPEEAEPYLSQALLQGAGILYNTIAAYCFVFSAQRSWNQLMQIANLGLTLLLGLKQDGPNGYLDKTHMILLLLLAHAQLRTGDRPAAAAGAAEAFQLSQCFDAAPDYGVQNFRYVKVPDSTRFYDSLGATARESAETLLHLLNDPELLTLWNEVCSHA